VTYLLDVSTLLAWLVRGHQKQAAVLAWEPGKRIAICPITELGFLRICCNTYGATLTDARKALADWKAKSSPQWQPCDLPTSEGQPAPSWQNTTDFYLANLADKHGMKLATLDTKLNHPAAELI